MHDMSGTVSIYISVPLPPFPDAHVRSAPAWTETLAKDGQFLAGAHAALEGRAAHAVRDCDPSSRRVAASSNLVGTGVRLAP